MASARRPVEALLDSRSAVWGYLDDLLREIPAEKESTAVTLAEPVPPIPAAVPAPGPADRERMIEPLTPVDTSSAPGPEEAPVESGEARVPEWAAREFQALLFRVGRLSLAVPLIKLHSVIPWTDRISALPNQPEWCHGAFRHRERNLVVIDTARLVLPAARQHELIEDDADKAHILVVGDGRWGLACRTVGEVIRLRPDEVKWRGAGSQRPWLAGTVLGRLCALMDTGAFADMISKRNVAKAMQEDRDNG